MVISRLAHDPSEGADARSGPVAAAVTESGLFQTSEEEEQQNDGAEES